MKTLKTRNINTNQYNSFIFPSLHLMFSQLSFAASGFIFWWIAAKMYTPSQIGMGSVFVSACSVMTFFSSLGIIPTFIRYIPEKQAEKDFIYTLLIFSSFLLVLFYSLFLLFINPYFLKIDILRNPFYILAFLIFILSMQVFHNLDGLFISFKETELVLRKNIFQTFFRIIPLLLFVYFGGFGIFGANGISALITILLYLAIFFKKNPHLQLKFNFNFEILKEIMPFSLVNFLNAFAFFLPGAIFPLIMLCFFSEKEAGFFYIPWMCFSVWCSLLCSIMGVYLMMASYGEKIKNLFLRIASFSFLVALSGFLIFYIFADKILFLFSKDFLLNSAPILKILFLSVFFFWANQLYLMLMNIEKDIKEYVILTTIIIITLVISILYIGIAENGVGFAKSWLTANFLGSVYVLFRTRKYFNFLKETIP